MSYPEDESLEERAARIQRVGCDGDLTHVCGAGCEPAAAIHEPLASSIDAPNVIGAVFSLGAALRSDKPRRAGTTPALFFGSDCRVETKWIATLPGAETSADAFAGDGEPDYVIVSARARIGGLRVTAQWDRPATAEESATLRRTP